MITERSTLIQNLKTQKEKLESLIKELSQRNTFDDLDYRKYDEVTLEIERGLRKIKPRRVSSEK